MILEYYGIEKSEKELRILFKTTPLYGTLWEFVESEIRKIGFELVWKKFWSIEEAGSLLEQSIPVTVGIKGKTDKDKHVVVLVDINEEHITVADPDNGELVEISMQKFLDMWIERNMIAGYIKKI